MIETLLNGNELNLDEVLEVAKNFAEQSTNSEEEILREFDFSEGSKMDNFSKIVKGVARKYSVENFGVERDDLEQDLWVKVMELIDSKGGNVEEVEERLVAKSCWNLAVDKYRYHRRRRDSKAEYIENTDDKDSKNSKEIKYNSGHCFKNPVDAIYIKEAIDLFPKGSKERKYVVTKLYMNGEIDPNLYMDDDELVLPESDTEEDILKLLGYNSKYPGSWVGIKKKMRETIYRYIGKLPDEESETTDSEKRITAIRERTCEIFKESTSYYIYTKKLCKDKVLKIYSCTEDDLVEIFKKNAKLVVGIGHSSKLHYLMKNSEKYVQIATEEGDTLL